MEQVKPQSQGRAMVAQQGKATIGVILVHQTRVTANQGGNLMGDQGMLGDSDPIPLPTIVEAKIGVFRIEEVAIAKPWTVSKNP
jgi:hypothetical protein